MLLVEAKLLSLSNHRVSVIGLDYFLKNGIKTTHISQNHGLLIRIIYRISSLDTKNNIHKKYK